MTDEYREEAKKAFVKIFQKYPEWNDIDQNTKDTIIRRLERGCHTHTIQLSNAEFIPRLWTESRFLNRYSIECYRISSNIDPDSGAKSRELGLRIISGKLDVREISEMSSESLNPEASLAERTELAIRRKQKIDMKYCNDKCDKCGAKKVIRIEKQTRSADELSNFHFKCDECKHTWGT